MYFINSHFVNSHFVNSHLSTLTTKVGIDKVGIDKVGIDEVGRYHVKTWVESEETKKSWKPANQENPWKSTCSPKKGKHLTHYYTKLSAKWFM